jgi:Protein of unknown function (DUF3467)
MSEEQKSPATPTPADLAQLAANLTFTRSAEYKVVYSNIFRTRVGPGEITIVFSRATHAPGIGVGANIVEEQVEVVLSWPQLKMFELALRSVVDAIEQEVGEIPIPNAFTVNPEGQRSVIRTLGFPSPTKK